MLLGFFVFVCFLLLVFFLFFIFTCYCRANLFRDADSVLLCCSGMTALSLARLREVVTCVAVILFVTKRLSTKKGLLAFGCKQGNTKTMK